MYDSLHVSCVFRKLFVCDMWVKGVKMAIFTFTAMSADVIQLFLNE